MLVVKKNALKVKKSKKNDTFIKINSYICPVKLTKKVQGCRPMN